jgi:uncharacterized protein YjdB
MASETVRVFVEDEQSPTPAPIENVLVRVFDAAGAVFISQDYTDALGIADFTLDGDDPPNGYTIRLSKTGVAFDGNLGDGSKSPQKIEVWTPPANAPSGTNDFEVRGQTFNRPVATDPRLCRLSGFFRRSDGEPYAWLDFRFKPCFKPAIVDDDGVLWGTIEARTDEDGYIEIDLFREGEYRVTVETLTDDERLIVIPDVSSENIVEILFSIVETVVFLPASLTMAVDDQEEVVPTVIASNQQVLEGTAQQDVEYTSSDETVAIVTVQSDLLVITAVGVGTCQIDVARLDESIVVIPDTGITYTPLSITVA